MKRKSTQVKMSSRTRENDWYSIPLYYNQANLYNNNPNQGKRCKTSSLLSVIKDREWSQIYLYLDEASKMENQEYPLHLCCHDSETPIEIIQVIFNAYPDAAMAQNDQKNTPLAIAIERDFDAAVKFLAKECPEAITLSNDYDVSAMQAVVDCTTSNTMVHYLVDAHAESLFLPDKNGVSAFQEFFKFWNSYIRILIDESESDSFCSEMTGLVNGCGNWKLGDIYKKTLLFLKVASEMSNDAYLGLPLHCCFKFESCLWVYSRLILRLHPEQALMKDKHGNLPIHIILSSKEITDEGALECIVCGGCSNELVTIEADDDCTYNYCDLCKDDADEVHNVVKKRSIKPMKKVLNMVKDLLKITPFMAFISDCNGKYPLHIAIDNHQSCDIVQMLFNIFPDVGKIRDDKTQLLPFMMAAVDDWENEQDQINSVYHLLREDPPLISNF